MERDLIFEFFAVKWRFMKKFHQWKYLFNAERIELNNKIIEIIFFFKISQIYCSRQLSHQNSGL